MKKGVNYVDISVKIMDLKCQGHANIVNSNQMNREIQNIVRWLWEETIILPICPKSMHLALLPVALVTIIPVEKLVGHHTVSKPTDRVNILGCSMMDGPSLFNIMYYVLFVYKPIFQAISKCPTVNSAIRPLQGAAVRGEMKQCLLITEESSFVNCSSWYALLCHLMTC